MGKNCQDAQEVLGTLRTPGKSVPTSRFVSITQNMQFLDYNFLAILSDVKTILMLQIGINFNIFVADI